MAQACMALRAAAVATPAALSSTASRRCAALPAPYIAAASGRRVGMPKVTALFKKADPAAKAGARKATEAAKGLLKAGGVKPRVEEGIFGTSGGIGFTKQNELFVGRVAMLGFAAALVGEAITGKGILAQFDIETGLPLNETEPLLLFFILFTFLGAIGALGSRGKFVDDIPEPGLPVKPGKGIKGALGLKEGGPTFGFTKANELFVGRVAQLGIAIGIIGELLTGKGPLAQLNIETGIPVTELEPLVLLNIAFFFVAAINPGSGKFISDAEEE